MKRLLKKNGREPALRAMLVAFHFPPIQGSSGVFRTIGFSRYLPKYGWQVSVLTAHARAYQKSDTQNNALIPDGLRVARAFALNTQKHLSVHGRYFRVMALPDNWQAWVVGGVVKGLWEIYRNRVAIVVSTFPIASAHLIGLILHRITKKPWVADFRDPMVQGNYPPDKLMRASFSYIESAAFKRAQAIIVVSKGTKDFYRDKYPDFPKEKIHVIHNGYDEAAFSGLTPAKRNSDSGIVTILHSGLMYERERNPENLFRAIAGLLGNGEITTDTFRFIFRAAGNEEKYEQMAQSFGLQGNIEFRKALSYRSALAEILSADALLVCQGAVCNGQIPAKIYEYLYSRKTIIGICDPIGDTGHLLTSFSCPYVAALEDVPAIKDCLLQYFSDVANQQSWVPDSNLVELCSREERAKELAEVLAQLALK